MGTAFLSEFIGTMVLIILGNGVCASANFKNMFAHKTQNWVLITFGWAIAVFGGIVASQAFTDSVAHLNPAVTVYNLIKTFAEGTKSSAGTVIGTHFLYIVGQIVGAFVGQVILNVINWNHIKENELSALKGSSCTGPSHQGKFAQNMMYEFLGTAILIGIIHAGSLNPNFAVLGTMKVPWIILGIGMSLGSATGYAINPVRDLVPRLVYFLTVKLMFKDVKDAPSADWKYGLLVPGLAPLLAGVVVPLVFMAFKAMNVLVLAANSIN